MSVLRFTAPWCKPCKTLDQQIDELGLSELVTIVDIDEQPQLAQQYGVKSVPTLVALNDGKEVKRLVGVKTKDFLMDWFPKASDNDNIIKSIN